MSHIYSLQVRTTGFILISVFLHAIAFFSGTFYLPVYYQVLGASATLSGVKYGWNFTAVIQSSLLTITQNASFLPRLRNVIRRLRTSRCTYRSMETGDVGSLGRFHSGNGPHDHAEGELLNVCFLCKHHLHVSCLIFHLVL